MKYSLASVSWDREEYKAALSVLASEMFTMGKTVSAFEEKFASWTGSKFSVFCNSGSSANLLSLATMLYHPEVDLIVGDEIIVPAVSWATTYHPITQLGLVPVFVDCDPDTLNMDLDKVSEKLSNKTKGIFAVNLLGNPNNFDILLEICTKNSLFLIEDNCESMGAEFRKKKTGSFGLIGTHSTFFSHHIATMEGGVCVTDDALAYDIMKSLRAHGWTRDVSFPDTFYQYFEPAQSDFLNKFHFVLPGYNMRPTELSAAIGIKQLDKIDGFIENRRRNASIFTEIAGKHSDKFTMQKEISKSSWFGFSLIFHTNELRKKAIDVFQKNSIECRPIVSGNMLRQPVFSNLNLDAKAYLGSEIIHDKGIMVGNHQFDIEEELSLLDLALKKI